MIEVWSTQYNYDNYSIILYDKYQSSKYLPVEALSDHQVTRMHNLHVVAKLHFQKYF